MSPLTFSHQHFLLRPATSRTGAEHCQAEEQAACSLTEKTVLLSPGLNNFLSVQLQADKRHLYTDKNEMY